LKVHGIFNCHQLKEAEMGEYVTSVNGTPVPVATQVVDQLEQRVLAQEANIARLAERLKPIYLEGPPTQITQGTFDNTFGPLAPMLARLLSISDRLADSAVTLSSVTDRLQI
jgi:hypothetical protein